ncbi:hypothetical protein M8C21_002752, partial [Ambrosia artemisiifolia]
MTKDRHSLISQHFTDPSSLSLFVSPSYRERQDFVHNNMSPVKFLFTFLFASLALWLFLLFVSRLVALFLSRVLKASVDFRLCGFRSLKDVKIKFQR